MVAGKKMGKSIRLRQLHNIDLNLLLVFHQLMVERHVSAVAESLGVSQPAVSNALRRLRSLLNDELFIRSSHGMTPTHFSEEIGEPIAYALDAITDALYQRGTFDPSTSDRTFCLALTDIGEIFFIPKLLAVLQKRSPQVALRVARSSNMDLREEMLRGNVDLAVGLHPQLKEGIFRQRLFRQKYVCVVGKSSEWAKNETITMDQYVAGKHVLIEAEGTGHSDVIRILQRKGVMTDVALSVPQFVAVGYILQESNLIATLPERLATRLEENFDVTHLPHPIALPDHSIDVFWHAKMHRDPGLKWFRRIFFEIFSE